MRKRPRLTPPALVSSVLFAARGALAQPDLPPPPPPPMAQPTEVAPRPATPTTAPRTEAPRPAQSAQPTSPPPPRNTPATPPTTPQARRPRTVMVAAPPPAPPPRRRYEPIYVEERRHPVALTIDPVPLVLGRLSGSVEFLFFPHHALIVSPNALVFSIDRGGSSNLISEGFGFATRSSASFGMELGYHYFWRGRDALTGPFAGPSFLLGATTQSSVDPSHSLGYWGGAFDVGIQEVIRGGFTIGGGAGLGVIRMSPSTAVFPRILLQIGFSP